MKVGDGKFEGSTSYTNDYLNKGSPVRAERVPLPRNQIMPEGKFDSSSTYTGDYIPGQIKRVIFIPNIGSLPMLITTCSKTSSSS